MTRRVLFRLLLLVGILVGLVAVPFVAIWFKDWGEWQPTPPPTTEPSEELGPKSFEELFADDLKAGWWVEYPLHLPGPYRGRGGMMYWSDEEVKPTVRMRDDQQRVVWEYIVPQDHLATHIWAETADGRTAHGLQVRKK